MDGETPISSGDRIPRRPRARPALILGGFLGSVLLVSCGGDAKHDPAPPAPAPSELTPAARIAARPAWLAPGDTLRAADFEKDPHRFACVTCHGPRLEKTAKEWKATCAAADCHFRPWPKTVFHRVDLAVFNDCTGCHRPHTWALDGHDCLSCHADIHGRKGDVRIEAVSGVTTFPHQRHRHLECTLCHESETGHGTVIVRSAETCLACHHGPPAAAACADCHGPREISGSRRVALTLHVTSVEKERRLPFDHERHQDIDCAECHAADRTARPTADCLACHELHHGPEARCMSCHPEPPAEGAHDVTVHDSGCAASGCHGPAGFAAMEYNRGFCLSCHQAQVDHNPGKDCEGCHKLKGDSP